MSEYTRNCPRCQQTICYTNIFNMRNAELYSKVCKKCSASLKDYSNRQDPVYREKLKKSIKESYEKGRKPSFLGKKHTEETKNVIRERQNSIIQKYKTPEHRDKISKSLLGENNPMYGKTVYQVWCQKYGEDEADSREKKRRYKLSISAKGSKNSMYGKPVPKKAGVGWRGYFDGMFFRSLRELMFIIEMYESSTKIESAEKIKINYNNYEGTERTYRPDFLILAERKIIEIKPSKLINTDLVQRKFKALQLWCENNGYTCEIKDIAIDLNKITEYHIKGILLFEKKYLEKYLKIVNEK